MVAGHETTATLLAWVLFRLSLAPAVQAALRAECLSSPLPTAAEGNAPPSASALGALDRLPLLDAVLRETLRLDPPVNATERTPTADVLLPLDTPLFDRAGRTLHALPVPKGAVLSIPIFAINTLADVWGPDAKAWRPARWRDGGLPEAVKSVPGVFGNVMSFIGGAHGQTGGAKRSPVWRLKPETWRSTSRAGRGSPPVTSTSASTSTEQRAAARPFSNHTDTCWQHGPSHQTEDVRPAHQGRTPAAR
jgi:hypothetical protein